MLNFMSMITSCLTVVHDIMASDYTIVYYRAVYLLTIKLRALAQSTVYMQYSDSSEIVI